MNKLVRCDQNEKKIDIKVEDRGDSKILATKFLSTRLKKDENNQKIAYPDGDSGKITTNHRQEKNKRSNIMKLLKRDLSPTAIENPKPNKINLIVKLPTRENNRTVEAEDEKSGRVTIAKQAEKKAALELKRIREKYALKAKNFSVPTQQDKKEGLEKLASEVKNSSVEPISKSEEISQLKGNGDKFKDATEDVKEKKDILRDTKKPLIKTIGGKNGYQPMYKAVTFVEEKRKRTVLDISIPNPATCTKANPSKSTDTSSLGPSSVTASVKDKPTLVQKKTPRRREMKRRITKSPIHDIRDARSPSTEVAKWAPSSVSQDTKPYYEAWVNRRLAAISNYSKTDNSYLYDKAFIQSYRKAMERPASPDIFYSNFSDERYTGKIRIRQK